MGSNLSGVGCDEKTKNDCVLMPTFDARSECRKNIPPRMKDDVSSCPGSHSSDLHGAVELSLHDNFSHFLHIEEEMTISFHVSFASHGGHHGVTASLS